MILFKIASTNPNTNRLPITSIRNSFMSLHNKYKNAFPICVTCTGNRLTLRYAPPQRRWCCCPPAHVPPFLFQALYVYETTPTSTWWIVCLCVRCAACSSMLNCASHNRRAAYDNNARFGATTLSTTTTSLCVVAWLVNVNAERCEGCRERNTTLEFVIEHR